MKKQILLVFSSLLLGLTSYGQVFTNKEVGKKNAALADSLRNMEYPYILPIWGAKATKKGYNLPYSAGLSAQVFTSENSIIINNLSVGFNGGTMHNLDGLVRFDETKALATAYTVRPDVWLFPFLNVYGIFGQAQATTDVNFGVWIPDSTGVDKKVFSSNTKVDFKSTTIGFGVTPTIGVGGGFIALDMNVAWTDVPQLSKPARSFVMGPRFGKNFKLKKEQGITVWAGGFRVAILSETNGSLALSEALSGTDGDLNANIDKGIAKVGQSQIQVDAWWNSLTPQEQQNPVKKAKYEAANKALDRAGEFLNAADAALNTVANSTVQYSMTKKVKDAWNFIIGSQYQFNKHFMVRAEYGFLGSRTQFLAGVQYRFGL